LFIGDKVLLNSEYYYASVYCFVSKDLMGHVHILLPMERSQVEFLKTYDLNRKRILAEADYLF